MASRAAYSKIPPTPAFGLSPVPASLIQNAGVERSSPTALKDPSGCHYPASVALTVS
jgi:hypothetical protein